jgi:hypothetical protein
LNRHDKVEQDNAVRLDLAAKIKAMVIKECSKRKGVPVDLVVHALMFAASEFIEEGVGTEEGRQLMYEHCSLILAAGCPEIQVE